jgi:hypothetical protein
MDSSTNEKRKIKNKQAMRNSSTTTKKYIDKTKRHVREQSCTLWWGLGYERRHERAC